MPDDDHLPDPRSISHVFPPTRHALTILLAIPVRKPNGVNCTVEPEQASDSVRYVGETKLVKDETTGLDEKPVRLGRKNFRLLVDTELSDSLVTVAVARVMRSGSGEFVLDPEFIPPSVRISASARLMSLTGRLIDILEEKSSALARSTVGPEGFNFSTRDIASFWFLHTVNASLAPLRHQYLSKRGHPEELFLEMSRLAGGLCTFALESHPRMLPAYDHLNPDLCFSALDKQIRDHLDLIIPSNYTQVDLKKTADYFYAGGVTDERCLGRAGWYLGVRSEVGEVNLITRVPQLVKVCSEKFVGELVRRALPGLAMTHVPSPPPAIPVRGDTQYFLINRSGPFWDNIVQTRRVGIYVPGDIPDAELDLLVALEA